MKRITLSLIAFLLCLCIQAQHRSEQEAIQIAQEFFAKKQMNKAPRLSVVPQQKVSQQIQRRVASAKKAPAQNSSFYIINDEENNRFVIVAADERLYKILGYSDNGVFNIDTAPEGLLFLLNGYEKQYVALVENRIELVEKSTQKEVLQPVGPLLETEWGQHFPYNYKCPKDPEHGGNSVTGCVATAIAQVMKYHNWPIRGKNSIYYQSAPYGFNINEKFSNYQFDWKNMPNKYEGEWNDEQINAVSQLMYACGTSVAMEYSNSNEGSVANPGNIAYAMINFFDYNPNIKFYDRDYFTKQQWDNIIREDIKKHRPILYGGRSGINGGHRFVLDGFDSQGLYHVNWGWDGKYNNDGYFELTALTPGNKDFSMEQTMVCNITPDKEIITNDVDFYALEFLPKNYNSPIDVGDVTQVTLAGLECFGSSYHNGSRFQGHIGIGVFDKENKIIKTLTQFYLNTYPGCESRNVSCVYRYDEATFIEGSQYYFAPYSYNANSNTLKSIHTIGDVPIVYLAKVVNGKVILSKDTIMPIVKEGIVGTFNVKALDKEKNILTWQTTITKAADENNKYLFTNFDPVLGNNTVVGYLNDAGNYEIKLEGQKLEENKSLYSSSSSIILHINEDSTMFVNDTWGVQERKGSGDNVSLSFLSQYQRTEYYPSIPKPIEKPVIVVDENKLMTISCATEDAEIRYTLSENGMEPTEHSQLYSSSIQLTENTVIEAKAFKNGNASETFILNYSGFVVAKPIIEAKGNIIYITTTTPDCTIYYTLDESEPTEQSNIYSKEGILCNETTTIKAIAVRKRWNNSPVASYHHVVSPIPDLVINNEAGTLSTKITDNHKKNATSLTISGKLNGTDIKFIREMLADGKLAYLDMENASIVEGGESYYSGYMTENNVVGSFMFSWYNDLVSLKLPKTAIKIDVAAISGCENLSDLSLPESCEMIASGAITYCENLEKIRLPKFFKEFTGNNFISCPNLKTIDVDEKNPYFITVDGVLFTKDMEKLVKYPEGINNLYYTIPSSVVSIGEHAFAYATIEEVFFPKDLTEIESFAFVGCKRIKKIVIPNTVTRLGNNTFNYCDNLSDVTLSYNINKIEGNTFGGCVGLKELSIGKNTNEIDGSAFDNCSSLRRFYVDDNNEWYCAYNGVLYSKDMRKLVRCPEGLLSKDYLIPEGVEIIGDKALHGCKNIEKFTLPQTLREIGSFAFTWCEMSSIPIPYNVSLIGAGAFSYCKNLETFAFPDNIKEISDYVLENCEKLSYVYIPSEVELNTIGYWAFGGCESLSVINCELLKIDEVEVGTNAFSNIPDTCTWILHCTPNSIDVNPTDKTLIDKYKSQSWWNPNWRIIQPVCDGIDMVAINTNTLRFREGKPIVTADCDGIIRVFSFDGILLQSINAKKGEQYQIDLSCGMYIINNKKIIVK